MAAKEVLLEGNQTIPVGTEAIYKVEIKDNPADVEAVEEWKFGVEVERQGWWIFAKAKDTYLTNLNTGRSLFVNGREVKPGGRIKINRGDKIELGSKNLSPSMTKKIYMVS